MYSDISSELCFPFLVKKVSKIAGITGSKRKKNAAVTLVPWKNFKACHCQMGSWPSICLSACCRQQRGDLSAASLCLQDVQGSEHPQKCGGFGGGWCIRLLLPGDTNAFQYSPVLQDGAGMLQEMGQGCKGRRMRCRVLLLLAIYFMPIVPNAVVFLHNTQCRINNYEDKISHFQNSSRGSRFSESSLHCEGDSSGQTRLPSGAPSWWGTLSQAVSRHCSFDLSEGCSSLHTSWAWPVVPETP